MKDDFILVHLMFSISVFIFETPVSENPNREKDFPTSISAAVSQQIQF